MDSVKFTSLISDQPYICLDPFLGELSEVDVAFDEVLDRIPLCEMDYTLFPMDYPDEKALTRNAFEYLLEKYGVYHPRFLLDGSGLKDGLNLKEYKRFLQLKEKVNFSGHSIYLRSTAQQLDINRQFEAANVEDLPDQRHFPLFLRLLNRLPFREIAKVSLIVSPPFTRGVIHFDFRHRHKVDGQPRDWLNGEKHFMWVRIRNKPLFIFYQDKKVYLDKGRFFIFNLNDLHGFDMANEASVSARIDGQFTEEFCRNVGLPFKPRVTREELHDGQY